MLTMNKCGFDTDSYTVCDRWDYQQRFVELLAEFSRVLQDLDQAGLALSDTDKLIAMPRGYGEDEEHEYADYLKLKSFIVQVALGRGAWLEGDIVDCIVEYAKNCASLLEFGRSDKEAEVFG